MEYIARHAEATVKSLAKTFSAILVTGARQVGKSTMLENLIGNSVPMLTFDDSALIESAANAPGLFFEYNRPPVYLDEIQKAPDLFTQMKMIIDKDKRKGMFYLSGLEQFEMMQNVSESLSGRIGILNLMGLSLREVNCCNFAEPFIPTKEYFDKRKKTAKAIGATAIWNHIHRGSMPELIASPDMDWAHYFGAYIRTYIERDVRKIINVTDLLRFQTFMAVVAARTGSVLNVDDIARDIGISQPTATKWLSVLQATNIVYLLKSYQTNVTKRAIKRPKLYFQDTGLAAYLTKWTTADVLAQGAMAGAFFETFVVNEVLRSYCNTGELDAPLYYYRDTDKREIDLLIVRDGIAYPIEIKKTSSPSRSAFNAFKILDKLPSIERGTGGVICMTDCLLPLTEKDLQIPIKFL